MNRKHLALTAGIALMGITPFYRRQHHGCIRPLKGTNYSASALRIT